jgi:chitinase
MMRNSLISVVKRTSLLAGALFLTVAAHATPWVMGYYTGWGQSSLPPSAVDYSAVSALIHFSVIPLTNGALNATTNGLTPANISAAVSATHAAGKKILFTVGGENSQAAFEGAISAANQAAFITNLVSFLKTNGYDGIDIDMEPMSAGDQTQFVSFATNLRAKMKAANPAALLTTTALWTPAAFAAAAAQFDQINIMSYTLSGPWTGWYTWHNAAVYSTGYQFAGGGTPPSMDTLVKQFEAAGVPAAKLGGGFTMDPVVWSGVSAPAQTWTTAPTTSETAYNTVAAKYGIVEYDYSNPNYHWDANAQAAYLSITNTTPNQFVSYDNEVSAVSKVNYVKTSGIGGLIIWDLAAGYRATLPAGKRDLLLQAIGTAAFGAAGSGSTASTGSTGSTGTTPTGAAPTVSNGVFVDGFKTYAANSCLSDGAAFGAWTVAFAGYGCVSTVPGGSVGYVQMSPAASTSASQTHAGLILGPAFANPSTYSFSMKTVAQLRTGTAPNAWEVGWFVWDYADSSHFYYFQAKPNGWELGKEDPAYPGSQRFLATGSSPSFPVGTAYAVKLVQTATNAVSIYVNGTLLTSFTDTQTPYTAGKIGLYAEDASVQFESVSVAPTPATAPVTPPVTAPAAPVVTVPVVTTPVVTVPVVAAPTVAALSPATMAAGGTAFNIAVDGTNFTSASVVQWNGKACPGKVQGTTRIVAYVSTADVAAAGTAAVTVATPGVAASAPLAFVVTTAAKTTKHS